MPFGSGQTVLVGNLDVLEKELGCHRRPERELALDVAGFEARAVRLDQEAPYAVVGLRPDHGYRSDRTVGDPAFGPVDDPAPAASFCSGEHAPDVATEVGLRETEAADFPSLRHRRQPALLLRFRSVAVDRVHTKRALHGGERTQPRVSALELLQREAVGHVVHARAAVSLQIRPEQSQLAELRHQLHRKRAVLADMLLQERKEFLRDELAHGIARDALLVGEQFIEAQKIDTDVVCHGILQQIADTSVAEPWRQKFALAARARERLRWSCESSRSPSGVDSAW